MLATNLLQSPMTAGTSAGGDAEVDGLLLKLQANLENPTLFVQQQRDTLERVKVLGRNVNTAGAIFTEKGIATLSTYGFDRDTSDTSREALRILANAFLLHESSRQVFVDLGYGPKAVTRLQVDNPDDEFLSSRILFLLTYNTRIDFQALVNENQLAGGINKHVANHSRRLSKSHRRQSDSSTMDDMAMSETLKLMFNITYYHPNLVSMFTESIEPIVSILVNYPLPQPALQPPITYLLNVLLNLDLKAAEKKTPIGREAKSSPLFPDSDPEQVIVRLVTIFDSSISRQALRELDQAATPLCTLLRRFYELASPQIKSRMRWLLLPTEKDREKPLGRGDTLASRLLRLSCSPNLPTLRENISNLLFELSEKDATKFIKNIGYGFAAGFLMSHEIPIPIDARDANSSAASDADGSDQFNPVTGQRFSSEDKTKAGGPDMTDEEKEREAERLYVLFERLKATGVVDVKNPVEQAIEDGRFEELD